MEMFELVSTPDQSEGGPHVERQFESFVGDAFLSEFPAQDLE